jgi:hypothetical protein
MISVRRRVKTNALSDFKHHAISDSGVKVQGREKSGKNFDDLFD